MPERETPAGTMDDVDVVTRSVLTASRLLVGVSARSLAAVEERVTLPQFRMLVVLSTRGATKLVTLADLLQVAPSTAMRMVDRLIAAGLADRQSNPGNRRETLLQLTEEGRRTVADVTARRRAAIAEIVERLTPTQRLALIEALAVFNEAGKSRSLQSRTRRSRTRWGGRWTFRWPVTPDVPGRSSPPAAPFAPRKGNVRATGHAAGSGQCGPCEPVRRGAGRGGAGRDGAVWSVPARARMAETEARRKGVAHRRSGWPRRGSWPGLWRRSPSSAARSPVPGTRFPGRQPTAGEGGPVCAALLVLYLCGVRAGRVLIGIIAVLAVRGGDLGRRRPGRRLGRRSLPLLGDRPGRRSREGPHLARV